jgi:hypothetical protein
MRFSIIILFFLFNLNAFASDKEMKDLFKNYDLVVNAHKTELVEKVFTKKFLADNGGKDEFIAKVKEGPKLSEKSLIPSKLTWKKGIKDEMFFAQMKDTSSKSKEAGSHGSQFIVVKEDGKLKIDGTLSDAE